MLEPRHDRLGYGDLLAPPPGFELDFAIGTTYSLDLDALIGISLPLGLEEKTRGEDAALNPVALLGALRQIGGKLALFCQDGQILAHGQNLKLCTLLEEIVFPILVRKNSREFASFHPKIWVLKYTSLSGEAGAIYRFIIMSRNLTFDRSWDVSYAMDGMLATKPNPTNSPLVSFLEYLADFAPSPKREKILSLAQELESVAFNFAADDIASLEFLPSGFSAHGRAFPAIKPFALTPPQKDKYYATLIISPFLSGNIISEFNDLSAYKATLITRRTELKKLSAENQARQKRGKKPLHFKTYTIRDEIYDGESQLSEEKTEASRPEDIHAKIYLLQQPSDHAELYLGSLNASNNAFYGNVEFMLRLHFNSARLYTNVLNDIFCTKRGDERYNPFSLATLPTTTESETTDENLSGLIKKFCSLPISAEVVMSGPHYNLILQIPDLPLADFSNIQISPLLFNSPKSIKSHIVFENLPAESLTKFFKITVTSSSETAERIIKLDVQNLPTGREEKLISSIINNSDLFYQYISTLLDPRALDSAMNIELEKLASSQAGSTSTGITPASTPALYERMLKVAADSPEKFAEIGTIISAITDNQVVPAGFRNLYQTFKSYLEDTHD